jgi:hypothetical protein
LALVTPKLRCAHQIARTQARAIWRPAAAVLAAAGLFTLY